MQSKIPVKEELSVSCTKQADHFMKSWWSRSTSCCYVTMYQKAEWVIKTQSYGQTSTFRSLKIPPLKPPRVARVIRVEIKISQLMSNMRGRSFDAWYTWPLPRKAYPEWLGIYSPNIERFAKPCRTPRSKHAWIYWSSTKHNALGCSYRILNQKCGRQDHPLAYYYFLCRAFVEKHEPR